MASIVRRPNGAWEARETVATEGGPRSRTLASFRSLGPETIAHALERATRPLTVEELIRAAQRAGAPVEPALADGAAKTLISELAHGRPPRPALRRLLAQALSDEGAEPGDPVLAAGAWAARTTRERADALADLLALADAIPPSRRRGKLGFPPLAPGS